MLKKIKKYKLSLFLLALVCMLSVYYVTLDDPIDTDRPASTPLVTKTRYQAFADERLAILDARNESVLAMEVKISSDETTPASAENYLKEIAYLTALTEQEVYLEGLIMDLGFSDSLVSLVQKNNLEIDVLAADFTVNDYIKIAKEAKNIFGDEVLVSVNLISA